MQSKESAVNYINVVYYASKCSLLSSLSILRHLLLTFLSLCLTGDSFCSARMPLGLLQGDYRVCKHKQGQVRPLTKIRFVTKSLC